jgi:hypothetical protein
MRARAIGLLLAGVYLGAVHMSFVWAQGGSSSPPAQFDATPIGKVMTATGTVRLAHAAAVIVQANLPPAGVDQTKIGDFIYRGDLIQTGPDGALAITFVDGTSCNISANARMEVNEFLYDPRGTSNSSLLSLTKGTFTFIAGNVAHTGDMKIDTPLGIMGIRGTAPRVEISDDGTVKFSTLIEQK